MKVIQKRNKDRRQNKLFRSMMIFILWKIIFTSYGPLRSILYAFPDMYIYVYRINTPVTKYLPVEFLQKKNHFIIIYKTIEYIYEICVGHPIMPDLRGYKRKNKSEPDPYFVLQPASKSLFLKTSINL